MNKTISIVKGLLKKQSKPMRIIYKMNNKMNYLNKLFLMMLQILFIINMKKESIVKNYKKKNLFSTTLHHLISSVIKMKN